MTHRFFTGATPILIAAILAGLAPIATADSKPPEVLFVVRKLLEENLEGPDVERTYFPAGEKKIVYGQPKGTRFTAEGSSLTINLSDLGLDGEIHVNRSTFTPDFDLAAEALTYREAAAKNMPNGAVNVQVQQPVMNPYPYNGWKSLGFTWNYSIGGRPMVRTVSYINLEIGSQLVITTLATKADSEKVAKIAQQFIGSWWVK